MFPFSFVLHQSPYPCICKSRPSDGKGAVGPILWKLGHSWPILVLTPLHKQTQLVSMG